MREAVKSFGNVVNEKEQCDNKSVEQDMFDCFNRRSDNTFDSKYIMSKLNVDMNEVNNKSNQSALDQIESYIQQNTNQKSSNSVDQIDQLINKSKLKQKELQMKTVD